MAVGLAVLLSCPLPAADVPAEIRAATEELNALRVRNAAARAEAGGRVAALEHDIAKLRAEARELTAARARASQAKQDETVELGRLQREIESLRLSFRAFDDLFPADDASKPMASPAAWSNRVASLDAELRFLARGGTRPGRAFDPAGRVLDGAWTEAGPVAVFTSPEVPQGALSPTRGVLEPASITPLPGPRPASAPGLFPVDPGGGKGLAAAQRPEGWIAHLRAGGPVMIPLGMVAVLSVLLAAAKALSLLRLHARDEARVARVADHLRAGRLAEAAAEAAAAPHPLVTVLQGGVQHHAAPREHLEEVLHERVLAELPALEKHLGTLAVLGAVAPLLGLLGTVTGMIQTFGVMTAGGGRDSALLAGGISEALITTEVGLVIAIPVLIAQALLSRRVRLIIGELERGVILLVNRLKDGGAA